MKLKNLDRIDSTIMIKKIKVNKYLGKKNKKLDKKESLHRYYQGIQPLIFIQGKIPILLILNQSNTNKISNTHSCFSTQRNLFAIEKFFFLFGIIQSLSNLSNHDKLFTCAIAKYLLYTHV